jgi:integrase
MKLHLTLKRERLTPARIAAYMIAENKSQDFRWDTEVAGFGVRLTKRSKQNPKGTKAYIFQGRFNGATLRLTIGDIRTWTLDNARIKARSFQTQIDNGKDPREVKAQAIASDKAIKQARIAAREEQEWQKVLTLRALCTIYSEGLKARGKKKSGTDSFSAFKCHVFTSKFADFPAKDITSEDISEILRAVLESGFKTTARVTRNYLSAAFNQAIRVRFDPTLPVALKPFKITSNPVTVIPRIRSAKGKRNLSAKELKEYFLSLTDSPVDVLLKMHLLSGTQRSAQLARITEVDYKAEIGAIELLDPKGRREDPRVHLVPLAPKGLALLQSMPKGEKHYFYSTARDAGKRVSEISKLMGGDSFDMRDLRRTCETMLAEMGVSKEMRGQLLSHGIYGVQDEIYNKYKYLPEKLEILTKWEAKLDAILIA